MQIVRIVGLMRSGSNLITWMLRNNFEYVATATMLMGQEQFADQQAALVGQDRAAGLVRAAPPRFSSVSALSGKV